MTERDALLRIFDLAENRPDIREVARAALDRSEPTAGLRERVEAIDIEQFYDDSGSDAFNHVAYRDAILAAFAGSEPTGLRDLALVRALIEVDDAWRWVKEYYPVVLTTMPSDLFRSLDLARAALAATPTASPTDRLPMSRQPRTTAANTRHIASPTATGERE